VFTHSDPKHIAFKKDVIRLATPQIDYPLAGPLRCEIVLYIKRPKSVKSKYPTGKRTGDVDNHAKAVLDALNSYAYVDDSQIVSLMVSKYYRDVSGIEVRLYGLN
jgi:Holliday junction resolvase RusA-like endonuclease